MNRKLSQSGFTLIELMIALVLGLFIVGATSSLFLSNSQTLRTTESLSRIQENARSAFELMSRDIREAGGTPCGRNLPVANTLNNSPSTGGSAWWADWGLSMRGYSGTDNFPPAPSSGVGTRVAGTDAIITMNGAGSGLTVDEHNASSAQFKLNISNHGINSGDILLVCDFEQASIFQVTNANQNNTTIVHNTGSETPGNCSKGLGYASPMDCSTNGTPKTYGQNSTVVRLNVSAWHIGCNTRFDCTLPEGRSLYFTNLGQVNTNTPNMVEVIDGVNSMSMRYLTTGGTNYVTATNITNWNTVTAVEINFELAGVEAGATTGAANDRLNRNMSHVVTLRNRVQ